MQYKIDLHTHSIISHDGGISADEYEKALRSEKLHCIAITDHNETSFARIMQKKLGDCIIVGEEISTQEGEIIGLYLHDTIPTGLRIEEAVASIKHQGGLVYVPHPFETFRKGLQSDAIRRILPDIDIVEVFNGRGKFRGKSREARVLATENKISQAASSDAHGARGLGITNSLVSEFPKRLTLKKLLQTPILTERYAPFSTYFYPLINRIKNKIVLTGEAL